ncbi:hypothetical protein NX773_06285 [Massilia solisilvae]|uniref:Clan AA aspartic protease n=1 Tax=Massilia solisilvae TaxID=1811225 RepID=A0ABT2BGX3_9BURK|nr:hypothetical protein [Massilia solisilvae]MCS0607768.1 hypothetical protein [Massilia solisilvae]
MKMLAPQEDKVSIGLRTISLGEPDDPQQPTAWQGPLRVGRCSFDIGIIELPIALTSKGQLFVATYSGSVRNIALFDLDACKVRWEGQAFAGALQLTSDELKMGDEVLKLDGECVPITKPHAH